LEGVRDDLKTTKTETARNLAAIARPETTLYAFMNRAGRAKQIIVGMTTG